MPFDNEGTTSGIQVFSNPEFGNLRVIACEGEAWFIAKDPCGVLGTATGDVRRILDDDEISTLSQVGANIDSIHIGPERGGRDPLVISEAGFYKLVMKSRKPEANLFQRWVAHEVLPSIRKHGGYLTSEKIEEVLSDPDTIIRLATNLKDEKAMRKRLEAENAELHPKAFFADAVANSDSLILVRDLAHILKQHGCDTGGNRLFERLRKDGYLEKNRNEPTQLSLELGVMRVVENTVTKPDGTTFITRTPKVTGKGQELGEPMTIEESFRLLILQLYREWLAAGKPVAK